MDLQYSDVVFGGDMNIDFALSGNLCNILLQFVHDLNLKFVYDKLPDFFERLCISMELHACKQKKKM